MKRVKSKRGETQLQTPEYLPPGPVQARKVKRAPVPIPPPKVSEVRTTSKPERPIMYVDEKYRIVGHAYDADSGMYLGLASDEERAANPTRAPFERIRAGTKMKVVIW